ncbi:MAG: DUF4954 family protein [Alistipes sp.]|nr:DUF4954 family protein [Alistipes sp.]
MRQLTKTEIALLITLNNSAQDWDRVYVAEPFNTQTIWDSRFEGVVELESNVTIINSTICNYHIGQDARVESVVRLESRNQSCFGNGVEVAAVNENGGRSVPIYNLLTAQTAYIVAMYRHKSALIKAITEQIANYAQTQCKDMGYIGKGSTIVGAKFIREVNVGQNVTIEGASLLENGTILDNAYIGIDVKMSNFIAVENCHIDRAVTADRVFVGENVHLSNGFTAVNSLLFACSELENGEACSIFAGPYTVSHHKSSLLIAGLFSFFNAGSGTNQSNHLFKCGAIHQAIHRRGCKFGSNGYVMAPAVEGEFTTIIGRHTRHHNTSDMPFSYLIEKEGQSTLLPAFGLKSYGTVRDIAKWQKRDKRAICRDIICYNNYNPLLADKAIKALNTLKELQAKHPESQEYHYNNTVIKQNMAKRGIELYQLYIEASLSAMLQKGECGKPMYNKWVDLAGMYIDKVALEELLDNFTTIAALQTALQQIAQNYDNNAHSWALAALETMLGHTPTDKEINAAIQKGIEAQNRLQTYTNADKLSDTSQTMQTGYGVDDDNPQIISADFNAVQGLN